MDLEFAAAMLVGYALTVLIEGSVLYVALSRRHPPAVRLYAGVWLTACTYPVVWLVLPAWFGDRTAYLLVAETFAPAAECTVFWFAFLRPLAKRSSEIEQDEWSVVPVERPDLRRATRRDMAAVVAANLCSFGFGELLHATNGFNAILSLVQ